MGMLLDTEVKCVKRPTAMLTNSLSTQKMVVACSMSFSNSPREGTGIDWKWQTARAFPRESSCSTRGDISVHGQVCATA